MSSTHIVQQGEFLSKIAKQYGFASHITLWNHEQNKTLKEKRSNPNILLPGDEVFIPDKEQKEVEIKTGQLSKFQVKRDKLKLRLLVQGLYQGTLSDAEYEVTVEGRKQKVDVKDDGTIEMTIPVDATAAELTIKDAKAETDAMTFPIKIGHLDPVTEKSGQIARLNNLGYFAGPLDDDSDTTDDANLTEEEKRKKEDRERMFLSAVEEFQCDNGLKVDGVCGPKTQKKLVEIHDGAT